MLIGSQQLLLLEALLTGLAIVLAVSYGPVRCGWLETTELYLRKLAGRKKACILLAGVTVPALHLVLAPMLPIRVPEVHDEYSYILAAKTFRSGRLTNPTHPMWEHFESFHINQKPTYMSMYPPAQGLALAAGMILGGAGWIGAWIGVCLSVGLMCSAVCWMLQAWFSPPWALWGTVLVVERLSIFNYWANTYWGGAVAAAGGALVVGSIPHVMRRPRTSGAVSLAAGIALLANSRPWEGLALCLSSGLVLLWWIGRLRLWRSAEFRREFLAPFVALLVLFGSMTCYYFQRVTGSAWTMPYSVNEAQYNMTSPFFWEGPRPMPVYRHAVIREYHEQWEMASYRRLATIGSKLKEVAAKFRDLWVFFLGPAASVPLLMLPWAIRDRRVMCLALICVPVLAAIAPVYWMTFPHYAAPVTAALFGVVTGCAMCLRRLTWRSRPLGLFLVRAVPLLGLATMGVRAAVPHWFALDTASHSWCCVGPGNVSRDRIVKQLASMRPKNLVIVRYGPDHKVRDEWVYNDPDIDRSSVVWAREMNPAEDRRLAAYFRDRAIWLLEPDLTPPRLTPWAPAPVRAAETLSAETNQYLKGTR